VNQVQRDGDQNARFQQMEQELFLREREIELLKETVSAINSQLDLGTVFDMVAERAR
jgi:hypothetical protein